MANYNTKWTAEQVAELKRMRAEGMSAALIGKKIGVSRSAILGKLFRIGLSDGSYKQPAIRKPRRGEYNVGNVAERIRKKREKLRIQPSQPILPVVEYVEEPTQNDLDIPSSQRKSLADLNENTCRWPVGDPQSPEFFFCGAEPQDCSPYCPGHHRIAYVSRKISDEEHTRRSFAQRRAHHRRMAERKAA